MDNEFTGDGSALSGFGARHARIFAGVLAASGVAALFATESRLITFLVVPVIVGCLPALLSRNTVSRWLDQLEPHFDAVRLREDVTSRWFLRPIATGLAWIWALTANIGSEYVRAGARLAAAGWWIGTLMLAALAAGIMIFKIVMFVLTMLLIIFFGVVMLFGSDGNSRSSSSSSSSSIPFPGLGGASNGKPGRRLYGTRLTDAGFLGFDTNTGIAIDRNGRIVEEGILDKPTGYRIKEDGAIVKESAFFDNHTGYRINEKGQVVQDGFLTSTSTGTRIDKDGSIKKEGILWDTDTGSRFKKR